MKDESMNNSIMNFYIKTLSDLEQMNLITSNEKSLALQYLVTLELQNEKQLLVA